jgi:hypothetical protein
MRRATRLALVLLTLLVLPSPAAAAGATADVANTSIALDRSVFVPCARGGEGETVALSGSLHTLFVTTELGDRTLVHETFNPMNVTGIGDGGGTYRATGSTVSTSTSTAAAERATMTNTFMVVGRGPGSALMIHTVLHVVLLAGGGVDVTVDRVSIECR